MDIRLHAASSPDYPMLYAPLDHMAQVPLEAGFQFLKFRSYSYSIPVKVRCQGQV